MKHHSWTYRVAETAVGLAIEALKNRFSDLSVFLGLVDWTKADLEAWIQNPGGAQLQETATVYLYALSVPDDQNSGPILNSMAQQAEVGRGFVAAEAGHVHEAGLAGSPTMESETRDAPPSATDSADAKALVQFFFDFTGQLEKLFIKMGLVTLEQVEGIHRETEATVRRESMHREPVRREQFN